MKNLSVYVHIPFCEKKCDYCDFTSFCEPSDKREEYVGKLIEEISGFDGTGYVVDSIFFGGGTPTLLTCEQFERIVRSIKENFDVQIQEFTVEGNPNSYTKEKVALYKRLGVTRLSVGVQSLNDKVLRGIGRIHTAEQGEECIKMLVASGLDVNCDMMIGLPYQTADIAQRDMQKVVDLGVTSVSCYSLILEEGTPLYHKVNMGEVTLPDEDLTVDIFEKCANILQKSGLKWYEVSNFGKPCIHNVGYWTLKEYAGFGLSAHSLIGNIRYYNTHNLDEYINGADRLFEEELTLDDMCKEYVMLALRMSDGINLQFFEHKFGKQKLLDLKQKIDIDKKYYNINKNNICIKPEYVYVSNSLIVNLL